MSEIRTHNSDQPSPLIAEFVAGERFDLSTIMGIPIADVELPDEATTSAQLYIAQEKKAGANAARLAELTWAFRRQLQRNLKTVETAAAQDTAGDASAQEPQRRTRGGKKKQDRLRMLTTDANMAFSLEIYRLLLQETNPTMQEELSRHETERRHMNMSYEQYQHKQQELNDQYTQLNYILTDMFKRAGQEPEPVELARRALLEDRIDELHADLDAIKKEKL